MHRVSDTDLKKASFSLSIINCCLFFLIFPITAARLKFSTYSPDGSDIDTLMGFAYDSTIAYFRAVDYMLKNNMVTAAALNSTHLSGRKIKTIMAANISFVGVTGNVAFSSGRLGSETYGYGDRSAGQGYVVFNFHNNATWGAFKRIGRWSDEHHYLNCDAEPNPNGNGFIITPDWMGGCYLPMQTSLDDHVTLLNDRADDIIQRMPVALKVPLFLTSHTPYLTPPRTISFHAFPYVIKAFSFSNIPSHYSSFLSCCPRPCFCS